MKKSVFIPFGLKCKFMKYRILFLLILFCSFPLAAKSYIKVSANVSASVYIDGRYKGITPITVEVSEGTHTVRVEKTDYKNYTETVTVSKDSEKYVHASLQKLTGTISVKSNISGATIYVDGRYEGKTHDSLPYYVLNINEGLHAVKLTKEGYNDITQTVYVSADRTSDVNAKFIGATLIVTSNQEYFTVYIDNKEKKSSNDYSVTIEDIEPGYHTVKIDKIHYNTASEKILFKAGHIHTFTGLLEKISGYVNIETEPRNAVTKISGASNTRIEPHYYEVDQGVCEVTARAFGFEEKTERISVAKDKTTNIKIKLDKAVFKINSLDTDAPSFNPNNKNVLSEVKIRWSVNAPEKGILTIQDNNNNDVYSQEVEFTDWTGSIIWDGKKNALPVESGVYKIKLSAGGEQIHSYITVDKTINDFLQVSRGGEPDDTTFYFNFSWVNSDFYKGKNIGLSFLFSDSEHIYGGLGADLYLTDSKDGEEKANSVPWSIDFRMGACCNYFSFRPYIEGGIGGYPWGLFLYMSLGFDFFVDSYSIGAYYSLKNFRGESKAHCFGFTVGF